MGYLGVKTCQVSGYINVLHSDCCFLNLVGAVTSIHLKKYSPMQANKKTRNLPGFLIIS